MQTRYSFWRPAFADLGFGFFGSAAVASQQQIGAVLGGSATQGSIKNNKKYLIFSYKGINEIQYILFDVSNMPSQAKQFVREFRDLKK